MFNFDNYKMLFKCPSKFKFIHHSIFWWKWAFLFITLLETLSLKNDLCSRKVNLIDSYGTLLEGTWQGLRVLWAYKPLKYGAKAVQWLYRDDFLKEENNSILLMVGLDFVEYQLKFNVTNPRSPKYIF